MRGGVSKTSIYCRTSAKRCLKKSDTCSSTMTMLILEHSVHHAGIWLMESMKSQQKPPKATEANRSHQKQGNIILKTRLKKYEKITSPKKTSSTKIPHEPLFCPPSPPHSTTFALGTPGRCFGGGAFGGLGIGFCFGLTFGPAAAKVPPGVRTPEGLV